MTIDVKYRTEKKVRSAILLKQNSTPDVFKSFSSCLQKVLEFLAYGTSVNACF